MNCSKNLRLLLINLLWFSSTALFSQITFTEHVPSPFQDVSESSVASSDVDLDGDRDVVIAGRFSGSAHKTWLYKNDGSGNFTLDSNATLAGASNSSIAFTDIEGDGDEDLLITGQNSGSPLLIISKLYANDGSGNFSLISGTTISPVQNSSVDFADVDGNGTPDLIVSGDGGGSNYVLELYTCDNLGNYSLVSGMFPFGIRYSDVIFFDADGDQDMDLIVTGLAFMSPGTEYKASLFLNDGNGQFTEDMNAAFTGVSNASLAIADVENDGDMDVFIAGGASGQGKTAKLYLNNGSASFTPSTQSFTPVDKASAAFADVDLDGDADLLHSGEASSSKIAELYINDGAGNFSIAANMPFTGVGNGAVLFDDFNNDGKPDLIITGESAGSVFSSKLYLNQTPLASGIIPIERLSLYPNPAREEIYISGLNTSRLDYKILDMGMRVAAEGTLHDNRINIKGLQAGVYILKLSHASQCLYVERILIEQ